MKMPLQVPAVDDPEFMQAISGAVSEPILIGGKAELLNNGDQIWENVFNAIRSAKYSINFMVYAWEPGMLSDMMFDLFIDKAKRRVEVRILLDGWGGFKAPGDKISELRKAGGIVGYFRSPHLGKLNRFHKRNHRRAIIIDGEVGYLGGAAVADKWLGNAEDKKSWRDYMVKVTYNMAQSLQYTFAQIWADTQGEILVGPKFYPILPKSPDENVMTKHISVSSSPTYESYPLRNVFWLTVAAARKNLYISHSYFVPDKDMREVLINRARAGVDVRVLLPNHHIDGHAIRLAAHYYYEGLLEAGIKIYEYQPTMMHCKTMVVDGCASVVGSANFDIRSMELNKENVMVIYDPKLARQLEETFLKDLQRSKEIVLKKWKRRSWLFQILEWFAVLFEEQY